MLNEEPVLSGADQREIEALYRKITTPWHCRFGVHQWEPWAEIGGIAMELTQFCSGRRSAPTQIDIELRVCRGCMKLQTRAKQRRYTGTWPPPDAEEIEGEDDDDE